jgi:isocitrate/isopropylmalate dehydrogenase
LYQYRCSVVWSYRWPSMNDKKQKCVRARIVKIEKRIRSFANIRPIKPYPTLLDLLLWKKK